MRALFDFDSVVTELGGTNAVARLTGNLSQAVCNWRSQRGRFPSKHYLVMREALAEKGCYGITSLWGQTSEAENLRKASQRKSA
jgi:hypothetical protein